jgi:hypothetical protein
MTTSTTPLIVCPTLTTSTTTIDCRLIPGGHVFNLPQAICLTHARPKCRRAARDHAERRSDDDGDFDAQH